MLPSLGRALFAAMLLTPAALGAQVVACDFDVADNEGLYMVGNVLRLTGRPGASSSTGTFHIINADKPELDVDHDGYAVGCDFNQLIIPEQLRVQMINVDNPALAIPAQNIIVSNLPQRLPSGLMAKVNVYVELPAGTVAGRYVGSFQIRDNQRTATLSPTSELLNVEQIFVEVVVVEQRSIGLVNAESNTPLDSVVMRGRAGQRVSAPFRVANTGNAPLSDLRFAASDLRSESAVGLVIPAQNVIFSPPSLSALSVRDTQRLVVTVAIPRGILGGRYRGTITVQGENAVSQTIPLIVIVTSTRGLLFANNPVREGVAQIAFNGDPGTTFNLGIFDMSGLMVHVETGQVFPGVGGSAGNPTSGADFAHSVLWPLTNDRGEAVASGMYLVVVESTVNGKRQQTRDRLMVIR